MHSPGHIVSGRAASRAEAGTACSRLIAPLGMLGRRALPGGIVGAGEAARSEPAV